MKRKMIKFAIAGKLDYYEKGKAILEEHGYIPTLELKCHEVPYAQLRTDAETPHVISLKDEIQSKGIELFIGLAHPYILTREEINLFPKGAINIHAGIPNYCGRHPLNWMIIDGLEKLPVSIHYISEKVDGGDIILEDYAVLRRNDNYGEVMERITDRGASMLLKAVQQIENDSVYRVKQRLRRTHPPKRTPTDSEIDWRKKGLHDFIRALTNPMPNAFTYIENGQIVKFRNSDVGDTVGEIVAKTTDNRHVVSTQEGVVLVELDKDLDIGDKFKKK